MSSDTPLSYQQAIEIVIKHASALKPSGTERVSLLQSGGRVLAVGVCADRDMPPFPRSTRDGFAVNSAECAKAGVELKVIGEVRAGTPPDEMPRAMGSGECVEIMTGAPVPPAADAVLMYEYATRKGDTIITQREVRAGENIVPAGAEAHTGNTWSPV